MRFTISVLVILLTNTFCSVAQKTGTVKGTVADSASNIKLYNASVSVLNEKDSTLVTFTRVAGDGSFTINNLPQGRFIMLITYPEYADYVDQFKLDSVKPEINLGHINMTLTSKLLAEVIVKAKPVAIRIKGDTTEFDAGAYVIQPDSKVEDLLKQLPGIQVDKDGKITAQGEKVNKVLVDGEEFFGDDPTLVTKNLRADMVDKVQLYDKKSDQATFTGIDDGQKTKTINIKLKEDKKKGTFGKIDAGPGTEKFYQGQIIYNRFNAKQKMSAYGTIANTGKTGLSWEDENKAVGSNLQMSDDGGMYYYGQGWDDMTYFGEGIPIARTGGLHYDNKWDEDKHSINTNYKLGSLTVDGTKNIITQNNLPQSVLRNSSDQIFHNFVFRQKLDGVYQLKIDTTSNLKLSFDGTFKRSQTINSVFAEGYRNDTLLNRSANNVLSNANQRMFNASAFYTKKLKKKGRTISVNLSQSFNERTEKDSLKSTIDFYRDGKPDREQVNDQFRRNDVTFLSVNSNITYTEPITPKLSLALSYGLNLNNSSSDRRTFNQSLPGKYDAVVDSLTNDYKLNQLSNQGGATFNYRGQKFTANIGTRAAAVNFDQKDLFSGTTFKREFINWFPNAYFTYRFSQRKSLSIYYNGSTNQPSINQIQPVRTGNDFLNLTLGNPDLTPSFTNNFSAYFNSYKVLSETSLYLRGNYSFTTNPIVNNMNTNEDGSSTYQAVNLAGKAPSNFSVYGNLQRKIKKVDMYVGLNASASGNTYYNMVNGLLNTTNANNYSAGIFLGKYKMKKYDINASFNPTYTIGRSSLPNSVNNDGKGYNASASAMVYLPFKIQLQTDFNYTFQAKTAAFDNNFDQFLWNATITKSFLKENNLKLALAGYDLLNQKTGFSRNSVNNSITQTRATTIRRLFLFSVIYEFNKMGGAKNTN
ncbi:TonB-dependent receptor [Mucilaginibacter hurinus]|uniref:TonB-dependent receptor n=1 Tax=Mucilaginibacter hurinus TaxID=2201324 RepID=A0A367GJJ1_9SPHI|nr:outer membrane beta-barrel family protein [Mucilaginibacter hurinus]RCH53612.1 TonB-dependent receptor [Mucilaginibacter hurinus]